MKFDFEKMKNNGLTLGRLLEKLRESGDDILGIPADTPVLIQRVQDVYFEEHSWKPDIQIPKGTENVCEEDCGDWIHAWDIMVYEDEDKKKAIFIGAFY